MPHTHTHTLIMTVNNGRTNECGFFNGRATLKTHNYIIYLCICFSFHNIYYFHSVRNNCLHNTGQVDTTEAISPNEFINSFMFAVLSNQLS